MRMAGKIGAGGMLAPRSLFFWCKVRVVPGTGLEPVCPKDGRF